MFTKIVEWRQHIGTESLSALRSFLFSSFKNFPSVIQNVDLERPQMGACKHSCPCMLLRTTLLSTMMLILAQL